MLFTKVPARIYTDAIWQIVGVGLQSESPGVVRASSHLLATFFPDYRNDSSGWFREFYELAESLLQQSDFNRPASQPFIVMAIGTIFERVRTHESSKEKQFLLIKIIIRVRIDTRTGQGQADANQLFEPRAKL
jgi:hypothetical protein